MKFKFKSLIFALLCLSSSPVLAADAVPQWIWPQAKGADGEKAYFRKIIPITKGAKAFLYASCDNQLKVFVNGKPVAQGKDWETPVRVNITPNIVEGDNLIAIEGRNEGAGAAGLVVKIVIENAGKKQEIITDTSWKISSSGGKGWNTDLKLDESAWKAPVSVAPLGAGPWASRVDKVTLEKGAKEGEATPIAAMKVKEGFKVELLYSVPMITEGSWVVSCFDDKGRLIVSDQYGKLFRITVPALGGKPSDTKVEEIPVEMGEAQGLCFLQGKLYVVTNSGKYPRGLYRVTDANGDDTFDTVETLRLFPNQGGEHGPHAVLPSPDGQSLYVVIGNQTPLTEMDTSRVPRHWAEDNLIEPPLLGRGFMRDVMAPGGWVAKTDLDGKKWELVTTGFRNQYDAAFNRAGALFTFDADMEWDMSVPWYRPTRVNEVVSGGEYGWRSLSKKWPTRWEDSLPPVVDIGPGSPTGVAFGYGTTFPKKYQEALYISDWSYGKLFAVHLKEQGGGYVADFEEFISGRPLPLTDVMVSPKDHALYFTIGGRRVQSGLYRVTAEKPEEVIAAHEVKPGPLIQLRHQLEAFHGKQDPKAIEFAWPYLGHEDRYVRFAARIAIEHQPVASWKEKALAEKDPRTALTAIMALCRSAGGDKALLPRVLDTLNTIDLTKLKGLDRETLIRDYQLAFTRFGQPDEGNRAKVVARLSPLFPTKDAWLDVDFCELLTYLGDPGFLPKAISTLENAPSQEEQIALAKSLRMAKAGWTPELRERFLKWVCLRAPTFKGGASFPMFMEDIKKDTVAQLTDEEKTKFKDLLEAKPDTKAPSFTFTPRGYVKNYTVEDIDPLLAVGLEGNRNYENGRNLFGATTCFACHRFNNEGGAVGPDLSMVAGKYSPRDLLVHIIEPNKEISDQYGQQEVTLKDGNKVYGRIVNLAGDTITLNINMMDPNALQGIKRDQVQSMTESKISMMPPGLLNTCKDTDILDLLAYLLSKGNKEDPMFK